MSNPFQRMQMLDKQGSVYWLEQVTLTNGKVFMFADVIDVDEHWMHFKHEVHDAIVEAYVSIEHIVSMQIKTR